MDVVEKRIDEVSTIAEELSHIIPRDGWSDYALTLLARLQKLAIILDDEDEDAEARADGIMDAFRDAWITTENKHKIHIGDDGNPDMGNPHVLAYIQSRVEDNEAKKKHPRKGSMVCESKVKFEKPGSVGTDKLGRKVYHFNHDEDKMKVTKAILMKNEGGTEFKMYPGEIERLTVFAAEGVGRGLDAATGLARQVGGSKESWKHVKGIATVVDAYGREHKADVHWFESPEAGQVEWKVKKLVRDMDESEIYWQE